MSFYKNQLVEENIRKIRSLFPGCVTETVSADGELRTGINFDALKQLLSEEEIAGEEFFGFSWVGKKQAVIDANTPIKKTLRPQLDKSINWEKTENIYIEGDNLEALKLLQESYLESIKLIYIDPPYNTGNDFIYNDSFKETAEDYEAKAGSAGEGREHWRINVDSDGRFHSKWCSMMFSRLLLARRLLSEEGVIFISIDDNGKPENDL